MSGSRSEESWQPIREALDTAQEAEDAIRESGGDGTECRQLILSLEDILLRVFEDEDIKSAHFRGLLRYQLVPDLIVQWGSVLVYVDSQCYNILHSVASVIRLFI